MIVFDWMICVQASTDVDLQRILHFTSFGWETVDSSLKNLLKKDSATLLTCCNRLIEQLLELCLADNVRILPPSLPLLLGAFVLV
jgi:hypothetical protein